MEKIKELALSLIIIFLIFLFWGCSPVNKEKEVENELSGKFNGKWIITAMYETRFGKNGGRCLGATGSVIIDNANISGSITDGWQRDFKISGIIDDNGIINAGCAINEENVARYSGKFEKDYAEGVWMDIFDCKGTWNAYKDD